MKTLLQCLAVAAVVSTSLMSADLVAQDQSSRVTSLMGQDKPAPPPKTSVDSDPISDRPAQSVSTSTDSVQQTDQVSQPGVANLTLSSTPQVQPNQPKVASFAATQSEIQARPDVSQMRAVVAETNYPQVVRRDSRGIYSPVNIPPGWKLVPVRTLQFNPAPTIKLSNGEEFSVQSPPFVMVPVSDASRVPINPRALQVLSNFYNVQLDLMRQLNEALEAGNKLMTPID